MCTTLPAGSAIGSIGRDVANRDYQVLRRLVVLRDWNRMDAVVAMVAADRRAAAFAGREGRVKRAEVGTHDFGVAHDFVEILPDDVLAAGPLAQPAIAPENRIVVRQQQDAIRHALQDALVLEEASDVDDVGKMIGVGVDANVVAAGEFRQAAGRRGNFDNFEISAQPLTQRDLLVVSAPETENLRHAGLPLAYRRGVILLR
jgi:hypothetical protein